MRTLDASASVLLIRNRRWALSLSRGALRSLAAPTDDHWRWAVYWLRNTVRRGEPRYAPPVKLIDIPTPWDLNAIAVDESPGPGRQHLVVSVSKDWQRKADGEWSIVSQLWRHRR